MSSADKSDEPRKGLSEADAELEREARRGRKFTLAEMIGRLAGPGAMKGVSPITRRQQAEVEIEHCLKRYFTEAEAPLVTVMLRRVIASDLLLNNYDQPLIVLAACVQRALNSEYLLKELVQDADVEWGRVFGERPHFEKEGRPADPDDPFTLESVRGRLSGLIEKLEAGAA
jgi:hypothetical protein